MKKVNFKQEIENILPLDITDTFGEIEYLNGDLKLLRSVIDDDFSHVIITDIDGHILYANKASENITGFTKDEIIGKTPALWGKQMPTHFYENFWKTIKDEKKNFSGKIINQRKNGELYEALIKVSPMLDTNGDIKFFVAIEKDITKEIKIDREKTEFISLAAHELRTPLAAISMSSEMLLRGIAGDATKENKKYLRIIYGKVQVMKEMIEKFLDVSKIEMGRFHIEKEQANLFEIIEASVREINPQIKSKKITLIKKYNKNLPALILDKKVMKLVLENLILNAIKYSPENSTIILGAEEDENNIIIKIEDKGIGIPGKDQPKIFTKMFRAENVFKIKSEGSGLGLYFVKSLIEQCGYTISFKSKENKGTTFFIIIPKSIPDGIDL
jgi:PAS domain S-box-containing protein